MKALDHDAAELLRAIVRPRGGGKTVAELATKIDCWEETIEGARQHGVLPMLYSELAANAKAILPEALELARCGFERNAFHCFANAAELLEVLHAFEEAGIPAMPFKGVVLAASAYGDLTARYAGDLDVLIHHRDLARATRILQQRHFELKTKVLEDGSPEIEDSFEYHLERLEDGMVLELRWRLELSQPRFHDLGMDWAWSGRRTVRLAGAEVPNLDAVSGLLMLCMHGSKHEWTRLIWVCDVAKLIESEPGLNWDLAQQEAKRVGLWRCLALGVLLAHQILGAEVPSKILLRFQRDRTSRRLADFIQNRILEEPGRMPRGRVPYHFLVLDFRDRAAAVLSASFLRPSDRDRAVVNLPKALAPLYYVIRPFRLLLDRTSR